MYLLVLEENNQVREAMHSCFLFHANKVWVDMAIVNSGQVTIYEQIPSELKNAIEDVFLIKMKKQQIL